MRIEAASFSVMAVICAVMAGAEGTEASMGLLKWNDPVVFGVMALMFLVTALYCIWKGDRD